MSSAAGLTWLLLAMGSDAGWKSLQTASGKIRPDGASERRWLRPPAALASATVGGALERTCWKGPQAEAIEVAPASAHMDAGPAPTE